MKKKLRLLTMLIFTILPLLRVYGVKNLVDSIPKEAMLLLKSYPSFIVGFNHDSLIWIDGTKLQFDDFKAKDFQTMLTNADIQDQFYERYPIDTIDYEPTYCSDPGRVRNDCFFKKMYGQTQKDVERNLDTVIFLPNIFGHKLLVNRNNGIADSLRKISKELEKLDHYHQYFAKLGGTFVWRNIMGTSRLSNHSFGIALDINVDLSHYWKYDCPDCSEADIITYKNTIPIEIVKVFEKYGFIWGGRWYHYDTMHFEFRPELLLRLY